MALAALLEVETVAEPCERARGADAVIREAFVAEPRSLEPDRIVAQRDMAAGIAAVDLLTAGGYLSYTRWAVARTRALLGPDLELTDVLPQYYATVLSANRRDLVSKWIVEHTPRQGGHTADPVERIRTWWVGPHPGRLSLLGDLLVALRQPDPRTAVSDFVQRQAEVVAEAAGSRLEVERSTGDEGTSLSVRVAGTDLDTSFDPVVEVVDLAGLGVRWTRDEDGVAAFVPGLPIVGDPIATAGLLAVDEARTDSWLGDVEEALGQFLAVTEEVLSAPEAVPSQARMRELWMAELSLVLRLRSFEETGN